MSEVASRSQLWMAYLRWALLCVPAIVLLGTLSGLLSNSGYGNPWFAALRLPAFMPPGWVFPIAWTTLYILLGLALAILLNARGATNRGRVIGMFLLGLVLNFAWSPVFFGMHKVSLALGIIGGMIVLTIAIIVVARTIRPAVSLLLLPYLAWLCFAGALNFQVMALNPDAERLAPRASSTDIPLN